MRETLRKQIQCINVLIEYLHQNVFKALPENNFIT